MKNVIAAFLLIFSVIVWGQKVPKISKTEFSKAALMQKIVDLNGKKSSISEVLKNIRERF